jgi:cysteine desulfurase
MARPIYLDYNATTPIDPAVRQAMMTFLDEHFGNPSSQHAYGLEAAAAVNRAHGEVADLIGAQSDEIVFTGGGSEASNHAIQGVVFAAKLAVKPRPHVITCAIEHPATLATCESLRRWDCDITVLPVDKFGQVDPDAVRASITTNTVLISIMHSNNEVGTLQPIGAIAAIARERGVLVHSDAAQSLGKLPINVNELGVDLMTIVGHKMYAPKGSAALYIRRRVRLEPLIHGAGHESGRRAGTENVPYIVGLGAACQIAKKRLPDETEKLQQLRDRLHQALKAKLGNRVTLNGHPINRLPNTLNVSVAGCIGAELLAKVPEVAASTGSACHEGKVSYSPVLKAMGIPGPIAQSAIRLSVGRFTIDDEVDQAAELIAAQMKM